jgi:hypothetical protein
LFGLEAVFHESRKERASVILFRSKQAGKKLQIKTRGAGQNRISQHY